MYNSALLTFAEATGETILALEPSALAPRESKGANAPRSIALIPLYGPLAARGYRTIFGTISGMDGFRAAIGAAAADPNIGAIVIDIDSPGGTVSGTPETAQAVRDAAAQKKVIAVANGLAASAAYWIGSQASEFVAAPSADVGSIGVRGLHLDMSEALAKAGIKPTEFSSSAGKTDTGPFAPLSEEASVYLQGRVDEAAGWFIRDVAQGRRVSQAAVKDSFGQGRLVSAKAALPAGMIDRVATLPEVISGLGAKLARNRQRRTALAFA